MRDLVLIVAIVLLAAGAGAGYTVLLSPVARPDPAQLARAKESQSTSPAQSTDEASKDVVLPIAPLLVNISSDNSRKLWIRLEGAVAFQTAPGKDEQPPLLRQIGEDLLLVLRTTPVSQLETAVGLEFLRDELADLVRIRTSGRARKFVINSLVIE